MHRFDQEYDGIFRLRVPFGNIYTSVFLILADRPILVDCATTAEDVDSVILPALEQMGYKLSDLQRLVLTHSHGDHAGGLGRVLELAPEIEVIRGEVRLLQDGLSTYPLAGHSADSIGILDENQGILLSGDALQGAGVDKYRCNVKFPEEYLKTLERIKEDERIEHILFSHEYEPWYTDRVDGRVQVLACLDECPKYMKKNTA